MPDFTRQAWTSDPARSTWEPRLQRIMQAWAEIEWRAVVDEVRRCSLSMATPDQFMALSKTWASHGLAAIPVERLGIPRYSYSSLGGSYEAGKPFMFRFVVGTPDVVVEFEEAWSKSQGGDIGEFLGYPPCCQAFFQTVWVEHGMVDTTWAMAAQTKAPEPSVCTLKIDGPPQANILWRWMGVRAVPHLPCSFRCEATVTFAEALINVGRKSGFDDEMDWLLEILSWPVEWSALHGIAEIKTPILKVTTQTDATKNKYVVQKTGTAYPAIGARGLQFPYQVPETRKYTQSRAFKSGLDNPIRPLEILPPWYATDNGFSSVRAMERAHQPICDVVEQVLGGKGGSVLDLGCGNGALLRTLADRISGLLPFGIDIDPERVAHAQILHEEHENHFVTGDMFDSTAPLFDRQKFALAIVMPGRFIEAGPERSRPLLQMLAKRCATILIYGYGDWLVRDGGLAGIGRAAGFDASGLAADTRVALVTVRSDSLFPYEPNGV